MFSDLPIPFLQADLRDVPLKTLGISDFKLSGSNVLLKGIEVVL